MANPSLDSALSGVTHSGVSKILYCLCVWICICIHRWGLSASGWPITCGSLLNIESHYSWVLFSTVTCCWPKWLSRATSPQIGGFWGKAAFWGEKRAIGAFFPLCTPKKAYAPFQCFFLLFTPQKAISPLTVLFPTVSSPYDSVRGGTRSLFLLFPCKDNCCPCNPCQRSNILVILARASSRGQKSWLGWYFETFCLWK